MRLTGRYLATETWPAQAWVQISISIGATDDYVSITDEAGNTDKNVIGDGTENFLIWTGTPWCDLSEDAGQVPGKIQLRACTNNTSCTLRIED